MVKYSSIFAGFLFAICAGPVVAGSVYRWVDGAGVIHFSANAPRGQHYTTVTPQVEPPSSAPGVAGIMQFSKNHESAQAARHKQNQEHIKIEAEKAARCAKARGRIQKLQMATAHRLYVARPDGSRARMTQPEFEKRLGQARALARTNCRSGPDS